MTAREPPPSRSFLDSLSDDTRNALLAGASRIEVPVGQILFADRATPRVGLMLEGTARSYLLTSDGKQLTVRHVHPGALIGALSALIGEPSPIVNQAVTDCVVLELHVPTLSELIQTDASVAAAALTVVSSVLRETYGTLAATAFGSMRERVVRHLLGVCVGPRDEAPLVAYVTQQQMADALGTAREVVARTLRDLRAAGLIETQPGCVLIRDPAALTAMLGRWRTASVPR